MNIFPSVRNQIGVTGGNVKVYVDSAFSQRASLFDINGVPIANNTLNIPNSGTLPEFQATQSILYLRLNDNTPLALLPSSQRTASTVTGAKGGNAALTSLIAALVAQGLIVDQTS